MFGHQVPLSGADFRKLMDARLKEARWQKEVERALAGLGWSKPFHAPSNVVVCTRCGHKNYRAVMKGWPDLITMKPPHLLAIELKTEVGRLTPEQRQVKALLEACGIRFIQARPRDRERLFAILAQPELVA